MVLAAGAAVTSGWPGWVALTAILSFTLLWRHEESSTLLSAGGLGWANALTGARFVVLALAAVASPIIPSSGMLAAYAFNVIVDVLDGHVARRRGEETSFGAVFDREVDAFFVLVAYLSFAQDGWLGAWMLLAGLLPYGYRLLVSVGPAAVDAAHKERLAGPLAGLNFALLIAAAALPTHAPSILAASVTVVSVSFGASFWSLRHAYPLP
jgi:phosphatidylglycerophosphate synthase